MIRKSFKKLLHSFSYFVPLRTYINISNENILLPFYHTVSNNELLHLKYLYNIKNEKQFKADLEYLLKHYIPVDFDKILELTTQKSNNKNYFWLSFDDGLSEVYDIVSPILKEKGIPFGIFVNTDFIDNKDIFYRFKTSIIINKIDSNISKYLLDEVENVLKDKKAYRDSIIVSILSINYNNKHILDNIAKVLEIDFNNYLNEYKPYLTSNQINELIKQGVDVGSHSLNHPKYKDLSFEEQIKQTKDSIDFLKSNFNINKSLFSFPFTDHSVKSELFQYIYDNNIVDYSFGAAGLKNDSITNHFQRFLIESPIIKIKKLITAEYLYYLLKTPVGKNNLKRK